MGLRLLKVNESIKETLSSVITSAGLKDPRIGFVTVTGVETIVRTCGTPRSS